ncbi:MAG: hypothetical protein DRM98_00940 [Thermoplasmata archaeon]|nr:MAG: hypothetical protein DRM98_00940 [Thermoplasmata archaeon]RLF51711.1 MAG: hypothetical protein DRN24_04485 [Thermoplasmata archaeon]
MNKKSKGQITGFLKISIIVFIVFSLGFFPVVLFGRIILIFIQFNQLWHFFLLPFLIYIGIIITVYYQLIISGLVIHLFNIKYKPGVYEYSFRDKNSMKWIIICSLYTPMRKILEIFPIGEMKNRYYRLLGMKTGENTLIGGTIMDPCLTEIGSNCTIGLYSVIYCHIHDYEKGTISMDPVKIGNNVVIGAGAYIMPGVVVEDNVKIAAGAVVTKSQILKKGKTYAGIPAREIKAKKKIR